MHHIRKISEVERRRKHAMQGEDLLFDCAKRVAM